MIPRKGLPAILAAGWVLAGCGLGGGNSGSETTNGLAGRVSDAQGRPVAGARVRILDEAYDPVASAPPPAALADVQGRYAFAGIAPGRYNLEFSDSARGGLSLLPGVEVPASGSSHADDILGKPGRIKVRVSDFAGRGDTGYVYVPGTGAYAPVGAKAITEGGADLAPVPAGRFDSLVLVLLTGGVRRTIALAEGLEVAPGGLTASPLFRTWSHSRPIPIDTKGMGIGRDVAGFPLLVRLTSADFDFAQAASHGDDLRFADSAGHPLPLQIERWDPAAGRAELWVRLDTVRANDPEQHILMYWGRPGAISDSTGPAVFAPEAGFATVYHLDEPANADAGGYHDASPNGNPATATSVVPGSQVAGVIGMAKAFAGTPASFSGTLTAAMPKGFGGNASFTVSFWLRFQIVSQRQNILDFGTYGLGKDVHFLLNPDTTIQFGAYDENATGAPAPWQSLIKLTQAVAGWTQVATVYDAVQGTLKVYVNGSLADSLAAPALAVDASGALRIGQPIGMGVVQSTESPLNGALDEVRFETRALTPERIKLDYATQKP